MIQCHFRPVNHAALVVYEKRMVIIKNERAVQYIIEVNVGDTPMQGFLINIFERTVYVSTVKLTNYSPIES